MEDDRIYEFDPDRWERMMRCERDEVTGEVYFNGKWWPDYASACREYYRMEDLKDYHGGW